MAHHRRGHSRCSPGPCAHSSKEVAGRYDSYPRPAPSALTRLVSPDSQHGNDLFALASSTQHWIDVFGSADVCPHSTCSILCPICLALSTTLPQVVQSSCPPDYPDAQSSHSAHPKSRNWILFSRQPHMRRNTDRQTRCPARSTCHRTKRASRLARLGSIS